MRVLYTARGIADIELVDEAAVAAKYGIPGRAYADFAVLRGDPSDGLPGVAGVGAKTAAALINEFGDLAGIRAAVARDRRPAAAADRRRAEEDARGRGLPGRGARGGRGRDDHRPAPDRGHAPPLARPTPPRWPALAAAHGLESSLRRLGAALGWPEDALG